MNLDEALKALIGGLPANPVAPSSDCERESVYLDYSESTDAKWKALVSEHLGTAKTFEIHCWNEENQWIQLALQYGQLKQTNWKFGKVITGSVTPAFTEMLLSQPKPTDTEINNKMPPFFNVLLDNNFDSSHYGMEIYL